MPTFVLETKTNCFMNINVYVEPMGSALITNKLLFNREPDATYNSVSEATEDVEANDMQLYWDVDIADDCPYSLRDSDDWNTFTFYVEDDGTVNYDWLDHAHYVLDKRFPDADEAAKDVFACEYWQNGLSDDENCKDFLQWCK